ncbi:MAG: TolC family protein [Candidatus Desulfofervidaceae bacterium]|nr:TolC family protein [Candidatus Desulfofervidaceae bacterium]
MIKKFMISLVLSVLFPVLVHAEMLDLKTSLDMALKNNLLIQEKLAQIKAAKEGVKVARSQFLPKLETSYSYTRLKDSPYAIFREMPGKPHIIMGPENNYTWDIQFSQPIFTGFYLSSQYKLSKLGVDIAHLERIEAEQEVIKQVKVAYFQVLLAEKYKEVAEMAVKNLEAHLKDAQALYDAGIIPMNDLLKSKVALANARQDLVRAKNNLQTAISNFNIILRLDVNHPTKIKDILNYQPLKLNLNHLLKIAIKERPELKQIAKQLDQMEAQVKMAKSQYYPQLAMVGKYERIGNHPNVDGNDYQNPDQFYLTLQAKWTFFEWGKTRAQVKKLKWQKNALEKTLNRIKDQVRLQVKTAYLNLKEAEKNIETARISVKQAKENYRITDLQYKNQVTTSTEVLDAQTLLTQAQNNYYGALYRYNTAIAQLERAIGKAINIQGETL